MPYDFYCASVKLALHERTCTFCGIYFGSKKLMENHRKQVHKRNQVSVTDCSRVRPVKIINFRNKEALCITQQNESEESNMEWIDVEDIDPEFLVDAEIQIEAQEREMEHQINVQGESEDTYWRLPVINSMEEWISSPWSTDGIVD